MVCPFLEYRSLPSTDASDEPRAYCEAADRFVQPLRADICNDRYDLSHNRDCEIYLDRVDSTEAAEPGGANAPAPEDDRQ